MANHIFSSLLLLMPPLVDPLSDSLPSSRITPIPFACLDIMGKSSFAFKTLMEPIQVHILPETEDRGITTGCRERERKRFHIRKERTSWWFMRVLAPNILLIQVKVVAYANDWLGPMMLFILIRDYVKIRRI
ncbi:hypothetical protein C4D60_Mb09t12300 [Musa balbisiana]|uniref:Uncharacterized protein n=1 Tax=Musa balbisiana TaxID=52838 RepID=A0A4S8IFZ0_MUSBA|nr:hypothetical protein C4D60_Mb09t12300 [Musa balbisiana]